MDLCHGELRRCCDMYLPVLRQLQQAAKPPHRNTKADFLFLTEIAEAQGIVRDVWRMSQRQVINIVISGNQPGQLVSLLNIVR